MLIELGKYDNLFECYTKNAENKEKLYQAWFYIPLISQLLRMEPVKSSEGLTFKRLLLRFSKYFSLIYPCCWNWIITGWLPGFHYG